MLLLWRRGDSLDDALAVLHGITPNPHAGASVVGELEMAELPGNPKVPASRRRASATEYGSLNPKRVLPARQRTNRPVA
ncbi:hypothetical protein [Streptomyces sp. H39-S7]|uniref:hypothetical protein n=1 Tax=Streptomyces sp. H39-S7 TaxID=3004357 RepID=UPI0022AFDA5A|nr:hypothetical protein [Streptomyces sp. H39-S7]MCZ4126178.1 hypothetical protein [Streptomyces sp. H39-S7]